VLTDPVSRRRFMALTGGSASLSVLIAACGDDDDEAETTAATTATTGSEDALAQFGEGDLGIVNYALTLEYLEAAFYDQVAKSGLFKGDDLALIKEIGKNEREHVVALTGAAKSLGGEPAPRPKTQFDTTDAAMVLQTAATVENLGAAAYLGQAAAIESTQVLAAALSIHTVEGVTRRRSTRSPTRQSRRMGRSRCRPTRRPCWSRCSRSSSADPGQRKGEPT
jgi:hypothetical protein